MELSNYSSTELKLIFEKIPAEIKRRELGERKRIRKELEELAAKSGYSLDELLSEAVEKAAKVKKQVAVKYRSPEGKEWTGRGRQPNWVSDFLASGGTLEQLAV